MRLLLVLLLSALAVSLTVQDHASTVTVPVPHRTTATTTALSSQVVSPLSLHLLSATANGCSQIGMVNATWTGPGYYIVNPSSFYLVIETPNAVYGNSTNVINPNNVVSSWYLINGIPITLRLSFVSCASLSQERLVYTDGNFFFTL